MPDSDGKICQDSLVKKRPHPSLPIVMAMQIKGTIGAGMAGRRPGVGPGLPC
ncbi:MAG: hypothetical protein GY849_13955 [Deltaproteobacteria bacterium]|nr:hypothetical protein [Deltaproteobacteria bacterium]